MTITEIKERIALHEKQIRLLEMVAEFLRRAESNELSAGQWIYREMGRDRFFRDAAESQRQAAERVLRYYHKLLVQ